MMIGKTFTAKTKPTPEDGSARPPKRKPIPAVDDVLDPDRDELEGPAPRRDEEDEGAEENLDREGSSDRAQPDRAALGREQDRKADEDGHAEKGDEGGHGVGDLRDVMEK